MPVVLWFEEDGWGVRIGEEITVPPVGSRREQVAAMMQEVAQFFEDGIREHPQDWHMLQPVFVADLDRAEDLRGSSPRGSTSRQAAARERAAGNGQLTGQEVP